MLHRYLSMTNKLAMQINSLKLFSILFFSLLATLFLVQNSSALDALVWPYEIQTDKGEITIYQPQLESFTDDRISSRAAVSILQKDAQEPVFGAMWMDARVSTDRNTRQVKLLSIKVTNVKFPDATEEQITEFKKIIENSVPEEDIYISLDHLLTMLELVEKEKAVTENLNTEPPKIIFVTHPAMLVFIDGEPKLQKVENTRIMRVINTPFIILFDTKSKTYYLQTGKDWMKADDVMGPWIIETKPPTMVVIVGARHSDTDDASQSADLRKPELIVTADPTELIVSKGEPAYSPIQGTNLLYMSNTDSDVFMEINSQKYYVLLSGRWFTSTSLNGPWSYVAADALPADFANIPEGSAKARVLANVADTTEANEAILDAQIPQTAAVYRDDEADFTVEYDGEPQFEPIDTTEMFYATNTGYSVIQVGSMYYLCEEAIWYESDSPHGPWFVSISVPQVIYTMPPSSPVYHVRYVNVYEYTPEVVYVGYYPGYVGTYIYGPTVIYGTGWYYRPWYRRRYYPRPYTWGGGVRYNHYTGGWGVRVGYGGPVGWYGHGRLGWVGGSRGYHRGYRDIHYKNTINTRHGMLNNNVDIERRYGDVDIDRNIPFAPNENFYDQRKERRQARDGIRGERPRISEDRRARNSNRRRDERSEIPADRQQAGSRLDRDKARKRAETGKSRAGTTRKSRYDNLYADRDGNVYRRTNQGWQKRDRSGWSQTQPSQQTARQQQTRPRSSTRQPARQQTTAKQTQQQIRQQKAQKRQMSYNRQQADLNRHHQARQRGTQRTRNYQQARSSSRTRSGGASRGTKGGGRKR